MEFAKQSDGGQGSSYDQMVAQQNQRANDSYNAQVAQASPRNQEYLQRFGGTSISPRATTEQNYAAMDADKARRQVIANAGQKIRQSQGGLAGLSNQASGGPQVMPMGTNQGMAQAPQSMPMAPGLNSLSQKAKKPLRRTLAQTYRT
jgi:hypothetical protein